jgi:hypothetical protein
MYYSLYVLWSNILSPTFLPLPTRQEFWMFLQGKNLINRAKRNKVYDRANFFPPPNFFPPVRLWIDRRLTTLSCCFWNLVVFCFYGAVVTLDRVRVKINFAILFPICFHIKKNVMLPVGIYTLTLISINISHYMYFSTPALLANLI